MFNIIDTIVQAIIGNGSYDFLKKIFIKGKNLEDKTQIQIIINANDNNRANQNIEAKKEIEDAKNEISKRLQYVYNSMNFEKSPKQFNINKLAYVMGNQTSEELNSYMQGHNYPSFDFLDKFASCFAVNTKWLKFGEGHPYKSNEKSEMYAEEYYKRICELKPESIFFIRCNSKEGESIIILKICEYKYVILPKCYHISSYVGATGQHQICSFYKLIEKLKNSELIIDCYGLIIDKESFNELYRGDVFPGNYDNLRDTNNPWWDDFTDIYNEDFSSEKYSMWYGEEFVQAQAIVRACLEQMN
ncbi:hypothetical protein [Clostridium aciditolerans]|uniref:HTH cro/C1-type domain-containing protein n=1 Tax=Clostridium aciditolerans TaxID=339861 RepID=A0A934I453_9CLOT|nr:hypothetical protein [Clostridium aciditolerans]MBI6874646.1 hypothetical protein [Clostridium aciditolerans]